VYWHASKASPISQFIQFAGVVTPLMIGRPTVVTIADDEEGMTTATTSTARREIDANGRGRNGRGNG
jgi:hypothetical protein